MKKSIEINEEVSVDPQLVFVEPVVAATQNKGPQETNQTARVNAYYVAQRTPGEVNQAVIEAKVYVDQKGPQEINQSALVAATA